MLEWSDILNETYMKPIVPLIKRKVKTLRRIVSESLGIHAFSKPYPGHRTLLDLMNKPNGFFVQCGGNDGFTQDPTYFLEKVMGWKGIIIEPLPIAKLCQSNRPHSQVYNVAVVPPTFTSPTISMIDVNLMSVIKDQIENEIAWVKAGETVQHITAKEITVPARTLQSVIDEYAAIYTLPAIDLLVIDIEGYEYQALQGLDFKHYRPKYILIEAHTTERLKEIQEFLHQKEYNLISNVVLKDYLFSLNL